MNERCGMCNRPADATLTVHLDDTTGTFPTCRAHALETMMTIAATIDLCANEPFDKAIAALERKMHDGTGNDTDLRDLTRYRQLREDARLRHPSTHTP